MTSNKIVLAYSGGLDTSVAISWLREKYGYDVIAMCVDVGEGQDLDFVQQKALQVGAEKSVRIDAVERYGQEFLADALKANAMYEGKYPLASALSRPLIAELLVEVAKEEGAVAVAHGCTGKGNDQVRFELGIKALAPHLHVVAPVREWKFTRDEEIAYAEANGIPIPVSKKSPYSIDANLWGRAIECGILEDPWQEAPEDAFLWTVAPQDAPDTALEVVIGFEKGLPVSVDGKVMTLAEIVAYLNEIGGKYGVGRIDHVENRLVGIKSREVYEAPGAEILIAAHRELESLTLSRDVLATKMKLELEYSQLIYNGQWFSPLKKALDAFFNETAQTVSGDARVKLFKGRAQVVGRKSENSLYRHDLATYSAGDSFDHLAAEGFIQIYGLPTTVYAGLHAAEPSKIQVSKHSIKVKTKTEVGQV